MQSNIQTGRIGEDTASAYLSSNGFHILHRNYRTKYGEIDLVAKKGNKIVFVEVKSKVGDRRGMPYEAVGLRKFSHMKRAAQAYVLQNKLKEYKLSMHVVSIVFGTDLKPVHIDHFEDVEL